MPSRHDVPSDPSGIRGAHDILSADEYPPPAAADADTPQARARRLPPDPSGISGAHDILAAEEFPPPAHADWSAPSAGGGGRTRALLAAGALGLVAGLALARRRRG